MLDEELRAALEAWVRPVASLPAPDIGVLRRRARRRGVRRAATAAAVTAVIAAVAIAITASVPTGSRPGRPAAGGPGISPRTWSGAPGSWQRGTWQPAGSLPPADASLAAAPYFVTIPADGTSAVVTDTFTGQVMSTVPSPRPGEDFAGVAAAGDDRTFVLAARETGTVGFYELCLQPDGREESLQPLFTLPVRTVPTFAVSQDASLLAYTTSTGIETVSLAAQTSRSWTLPEGLASSLSWAGNTTLAFEWQVPSSNGTQPAGAGVRLLDLAARGTLVQASRLLIPFCTPAQLCTFSPLITPDGSKLLAINIVLDARLTITVEEYSTRTGRALAAVTSPVTTTPGSQACEPLWTDPSGEQVAAFCGQGFVTSGTRFRAANLHVPAGVLLAHGETFAW